MTSLMLPPDQTILQPRIKAGTLSSVRFSAAIPALSPSLLAPVKDTVLFGQSGLKDRAIKQQPLAGLFVSYANHGDIQLKETTSSAQRMLGKTRVLGKRQFEIVKPGSNALGSIQLSDKARQRYTVEVYQGKDLPNIPVNLVVSVTDKQTGNAYQMLPGSSLRLKGLNIELPGKTELPRDAKAIPENGLYPKAGTVQENVEVMLLGGGIGTRIHPLTWDELEVAKPALHIGADSMLGQQIRHLNQQGFNDFSVHTFFKPDSVIHRINETLKAIKAEGNGVAPTVREFRDSWASGSAGGLGQMLGKPDKFPGLHGDRDTLVLQGDAVVNLRFDEILTKHRASGALVSVVAVERPKEEALNTFGVIKTPTGHDGEILKFVEKPKEMAEYEKQGIPGTECMVNTGIYLFSPEGLKILHARYTQFAAEQEQVVKNGGKRLEFDFGRDFFQWLPEAVEKGEVEIPESVDSVLHAQVADGYWNDVGNPVEYLETSRELLAGKLGLNTPQDVVQESYDATTGAIYLPHTRQHVPSSATVQGNVIVTRKFSPNE